MDAAEARARTWSSLLVASRVPRARAAATLRPPRPRSAAPRSARPVPRRPALRAAWARRPASGVPQAPWRPTPQAARASWWAEPAVWWAVRSALETRWRRWVSSRPGTTRISQLAPSPTPPARRATWQGSPPARARAPPERARAPPERGRRSRACRWAARSAPPTPPRGWALRWPGMPRTSQPELSPTPPARRATSTAPARTCSTTSTLASTTTTSTLATTRAAFSRGLRTWSGAGSSSSRSANSSHQALRPRNH